MSMKKNTFAKIIVVAIAFIVSINIPVSAFEREDHDRYMIKVLFNYYKVVDNDLSIKDKIKALASASYLCIDQFNSGGKNDLKFLNEFGVKNIPNDISSFNLSASGKTHRSYTHRGWDFNYINDAANWEVRKELMKRVAEKLFSPNANEKQINSFCALIYYIHILADHLDDESYKISNGLKMDVGGRTDSNDIINELLKHLKVLFDDQKHTHKYNSLIGSLHNYNDRFKKIVGSDGGINSDEKFQEYKKLTESVVTLLTYYLPEMLKDEVFFRNAFY